MKAQTHILFPFINIYIEQLPKQWVYPNTFFVVTPKSFQPSQPTPGLNVQGATPNGPVVASRPSSIAAVTVTMETKPRCQHILSLYKLIMVNIIQLLWWMWLIHINAVLLYCIITIVYTWHTAMIFGTSSNYFHSNHWILKRNPKSFHNSNVIDQNRKNRSEAQQKADNGDPKANLEDRIWRKPQMLKFSHRQVAELYCRVKPNWSLVDCVSGTPLG